MAWRRCVIVAGRLISVVSTKQGYSVFPFSAAVVERVIAEFDGFESTKGGYQVHR
jgi:hypothetical protein